MRGWQGTVGSEARQFWRLNTEKVTGGRGSGGGEAGAPAPTCSPAGLDMTMTLTVGRTGSCRTLDPISHGTPSPLPPPRPQKVRGFHC